MTNLKPILDYLIYNGLFYLINEPMNRHTTFQIGGPADIVVYPTRRREICDLVRICRTEDIPYISLGNGSNVLVSDAGIRGLVIMTDRMHRITVDNDSRIEAWAGAPLSRVATIAKNYQLSGLEFAFGIPGSVGGGVFMNAGAYGGEMSQVIKSVLCYDAENKKTVELLREECNFSYRHSVFMENKKIVVLGASFELAKGDWEEIEAVCRKNMTARREKQPLEYPSCGSAFKRPQGHFAGKLIEDCGLKGFTVGGAQISEKHAGFVVNLGGATAADVRATLELIQEKVKEKSGVELEPEVQIW